MTLKVGDEAHVIVTPQSGDSDYYGLRVRITDMIKASAKDISHNYITTWTGPGGNVMICDILDTDEENVYFHELELIRTCKKD